jgi:hypothetical protein
MQVHAPRFNWLKLFAELCIIIPRPTPRWAKWSRGVRTRGLRAGVVGDPRPLIFYGQIKIAVPKIAFQCSVKRSGVL